GDRHASHPSSGIRYVSHLAARRSMKVRIGHIVAPRSFRVLVGLGLLAGSAVLPAPAQAQRPFVVHDPFYRGETARRAFFDGYAFTTELSYRSPSEQSIRPDPLGLSFRLEYQISSSIDLGAILDAAGTNGGRTLDLSWLTLKYYHTEENTDYAFRVAVDPSLDGRLGNPQMDAAFISTTLMAPNLSSDYAVGLRRVRLGYEELIARNLDADAAADIPQQVRTTEIVYTRALGWEFHTMAQYSLLLNPARSNVFLSGLFYLGQYDIVRSSLSGNPDQSGGVEAGAENMAGSDAEEQGLEKHHAGALWIRSGIEYNRPSYQIAPFVSYAVKQWSPEDDASPARLSFGLRFMLR
ncbi:MAG TPA: hypothetical protein VFG50_15105, partial [Rhodothermales bacterium]|nr:hypothetical protein [Rhodothermales bacterium]